MNIYNLRCKELRKEREWSQEDLVQKLGTGLKRETLSQYETGKTKPDAETLLAMADAFGVSVDYLLGRADCKKISAEEVHRRIGLSEQAIEALKTVSKEKDESSFCMIQLINSIITKDGGFWEALSLTAGKYEYLKNHTDKVIGKTTLKGYEGQDVIDGRITDKMFLQLFICQEMIKGFVEKLSWKRENDDLDWERVYYGTNNKKGR